MQKRFFSSLFSFGAVFVALFGLSLATAVKTTFAAATGTVLIYRVGIDGATTSAPATYANVAGVGDYSLSSANVNPAQFLNQTVGTHTANVSDLGNFSETVGTCTYSPGGDCDPQSFGQPSASSSYYGSISVNITVGTGTITKVIFRYNGNSNNGDLLIYRAGANGQTYTAPLNTYVNVDGAVYNGVTINPAEYDNYISSQSRTIFVTDVPNFKETMGSCIFVRGSNECNPDTYSSVGLTSGNVYANNQTYNYVSLSTTTVPGYVKKIIVKYDNASYGDFLVYRVGADGTVYSAPTDTKTSIDASIASNANAVANPAEYNSLLPGTNHTLNWTSSQFAESVGTCTYPRDGAECTPTSFSTSGITYNTINSPYSGSISTSTVAGKVMKVVVKYAPLESTGDIQVTKYGPDGTAQSVPATTTLYFDSNGVYSYSQSSISNGPQSSNPAFFTGVSTSGTHTVTGLRQKIGTTSVYYTETYGTCRYLRGASECTPSSYGAVAYDNLANVAYSGLCNSGYPCFQMSATTTAGYVTKMVLKYSGGTSNFNMGGDIRVKRVGDDDTINTAPALPTSYSAAIDNPSLTSNMSNANPADFINLSLSTHDVYVGNPDIVGPYFYQYNKSAGICTYARGNKECTVTTFSLTPVCDNYLCKIPVSVSSGQVAKVVFKFLRTTAAGDMKIKRVGADDTVNTAPANTSAYIDSSMIASGDNGNNPYTAVSVTPQAHVVYTTNVDGYDERAGICTYSRGSQECTLSTFDIIPACVGSYCSVTATVTASQVTKVVFKYNQNAVGSAGTGDVKIKIVGGDDTTLTAPSVSSGVDFVGGGFSVNSSNPNSSVSIAAGPHLVFVSTKSGYAVTAGTCLYTRGTQECIVSNFDKVPVCTSSYCGLPIDVVSGQITKVAVKYLPGSMVAVSGTGSVIADRVNDSGASSSVGSISYDNASLSSTNPITYSLASGYHLISASNQSAYGYSLAADVCSYPTGGSCAFPGTYANALACTANTCGLPVLVQSGMVTKVRFKYGGSTGDVKISAIDQNGATSTLSSLSLSKSVGNSSSDYSNPVTVSSIVPGNHVASLEPYWDTNGTDYMLDLVRRYPGVVAGTCTYPRGGTECNVTDFVTPVVCLLHKCPVPITVLSGQVTKVVFKLLPLSYTISNSVSRINALPGFFNSSYVNLNQTSGTATPVTLSISGLPSGVTASFGISSCTPNCAVPLTVQVANNAVSGTYPLVITGNPLGKTAVIDLVIGSPVTPIANQCSLPNAPQFTAVTGSAGQTVSIQNTTDPTLGEIFNKIGVTGVNQGSDQTNYQTWRSSASQSVEVQLVDALSKNSEVFGYYTGGNLSTFVPLFKKAGVDSPTYPNVASLVPGQSTTVTLPVGQDIGFAIYTENPYGAHDTWGTQKSLNRDGMAHSVVYSPVSAKGYLIGFEDLGSDVSDKDYNDLIVRIRSTECGIQSNEGSFLVKRVGTDLTTNTAPVNTQAKVGALSALPDNPASFIAASGTYPVYTTAGGSIMAGQCVYDEGGNECTVNYFTIVPDCDSTWCSVYAHVDAGKVTKVAFKYGSSAPQMSCSASVVSGQVSSPVAWYSSVLPNSSAYTYSWTGTDGLSGSTSTVTTMYTTKGQKTGTVSVYNGSTLLGQCSKTISITEKGFIEH